MQWFLVEQWKLQDFLEELPNQLFKYAESTGSLIATTAGTCVFFNITASDQYLSIVVPGRMFADTYKEKGLSSREPK